MTTPPPSSSPPSSSPPPPSDQHGAYPPAVWAAVLIPPCVQAQVPIEFAVAWIAEESGGNPCAIGNPEQYGPDGSPREIGIAQLYNPDDFQAQGIDPKAFRAYCNPAKVAYRTKDGRTVMGPSQETIRPLTPDEMLAQANATVTKIAKSRSTAAHYAQAAKVTWPSDSVDFWRLVKLIHGLPGLVSTGLANVASYLGHPPASWAQFRALIESGTVKADTATEAYRSQFASVFNNAEQATATMPGKAIV